MRKPLMIMMVAMLASLLIVSLWDTLPIIKNTVNGILNPTFGTIIDLNLFWGFTFTVLIISLFISLTQKYTTDQEALKQLKLDQKATQEEMKLHRDNPAKMMELQKKQFANIPKTFELTTKPLIITAIPIILLFRWFNELFTSLGNPKFLGMGWIMYYILTSIIFSVILRKVLKIH